MGVCFAPAFILQNLTRLQEAIGENAWDYLCGSSYKRPAFNLADYFEGHPAFPEITQLPDKACGAKIKTSSLAMTTVTTITMIMGLSCLAMTTMTMIMTQRLVAKYN